MVHLDVIQFKVKKILLFNKIWWSTKNCFWYFFKGKAFLLFFFFLKTSPLSCSRRPSYFLICWLINKIGYIRNYFYNQYSMEIVIWMLITVDKSKALKMNLAIKKTNASCQKRTRANLEVEINKSFFFNDLCF